MNPPHLPTQLLSAPPLVDQQVLVQFRPEETAKGVFLHQGVDPLLGQVKGRGGELDQVPESHVLCEVIDVDLQVGGREANVSDAFEKGIKVNNGND